VQYLCLILFMMLSWMLKRNIVMCALQVGKVLSAQRIVHEFCLKMVIMQNFKQILIRKMDKTDSRHLKQL